jgi:hypothetical protein
MQFRDKGLSPDDVSYLTTWLLRNSYSIDWLAIAGQHVNEGTDTYRNYPFFDPLISSSQTGLQATGDEYMTFKVKGNKIVPWSIIARKNSYKSRERSMV